MLRRGLQVLADRQEIDISRPQVVHHLQDFLAGLAQAHHQARLGEHRGVDFLHPRKKPQRREVARAGPDRRIEPWHGLEVVVEDIGARRHDRLDGSGLAHEIRRQDLDRRGGRGRMQGRNHLGEVCRSAVVEIVAIDRCDDHVPQSQLAHRLGDIARFVRIEGAGFTGGDVAEGAGPRADLAHDHESRVLLLPTFADVGARRLFAHGGEPVLAHQPLGLGIFRRVRRTHSYPVRLASDRVVGPVRLFRMSLGAAQGKLVVRSVHDALDMERPAVRRQYRLVHHLR